MRSEEWTDTLATLAKMNARIEMLPKQILKSVGTEDAKIDAALYEEMLASHAIRDLAYVKLKPTPASVILSPSLRSCAKSLGKELEIDEDTEDNSINADGVISRERFNGASNDYKRLRQRLVEMLHESGLSPEEYLKK